MIRRWLNRRRADAAQAAYDEARRKAAKVGPDGMARVVGSEVGCKTRADIARVYAERFPTEWERQGAHEGIQQGFIDYDLGSGWEDAILNDEPVERRGDQEN